MNNVLLAQINGLTAKYEKELVNFKFPNDEFAVFDFEDSCVCHRYSLFLL